MTPTFLQLVWFFFVAFVKVTVLCAILAVPVSIIWVIGCYVIGRWPGRAKTTPSVTREKRGAR